MARLYPDVAFSGACTALITPFNKGGVDEDAFLKLVEWQISSGIDGLVPAGTTGESPTLSHDEHDRVVELCVQQAAGRVPVIAGAGSNNTAESVRLALHAQNVGADAVLVVTPYYNKPTQAGLKGHYTAIADAISIPLIIYDIPSRSIVKVDDETLADLARHPNIQGIKDATADCARPTRLLNRIGDGFAQLSGEDTTQVAYLAAGGHGVISVASNIAPALIVRLHAAFAEGQISEAMGIHKKLMPLYDALFCEASPGPVKYAAERLGLCGRTTRLPLTEIADSSKQIIDHALAATDLL